MGGFIDPTQSGGRSAFGVTDLSYGTTLALRLMYESKPKGLPYTLRTKTKPDTAEYLRIFYGEQTYSR